MDIIFIPLALFLFLLLFISPVSSDEEEDSEGNQKKQIEMKKYKQLKPAFLLKLADHIETLELTKSHNPESPGNKFSLNDWAFECGMPACAGGYACVVFPDTLYLKGRMLLLIGDSELLYFYKNMDAFAIAFGITHAHAESICLMSEYASEDPSPKMVANRMRNVASKYI